MGIRTHFGCVGLHGAKLEAYARRYDALELEVLEGTRAPNAATLRRWRKEAGPNLIVSLVAPVAVAAVRPTPALDEGLAKLLEAQRLVQARVLLIRTPTEVTPSELNRERLAKVIERLREGLGEAKDLVRIAWEARGVWESETAGELAQKLGIDLAVDPLADPREPYFEDVGRYWRLGTVGGRTEFPPPRLRALAEVIAQDAKADDKDGERIVVFATPHAQKEAKRLRKLSAELGEKVVGGGAVIRPRVGRLSEEE